MAFMAAHLNAESLIVVVTEMYRIVVPDSTSSEATR